MMQKAQEETGKWAMADNSVTSKFAEIDSAISRIITGLTDLKTESRTQGRSTETGEKQKKEYLSTK